MKTSWIWGAGLAVLGMVSGGLLAGEAWAGGKVEAQVLAAKGEYPSGTWRFWWPVGAFLPMAYYTLELELSGGAGTFRATPIGTPDVCGSNLEACPCLEGDAVYAGGVLTLLGNRCGGTDLPFDGTARKASTDNRMDLEYWIDTGDGLGYGASTVMRKAVTP